MAESIFISQSGKCLHEKHTKMPTKVMQKITEKIHNAIARIRPLRYQLAPSAVARVEAHGTGTALGDPIEAGSLAGAGLSARAARVAALALDSVKANTGHGEPAAGLSGLVALSLPAARPTCACATL